MRVPRFPRTVKRERQVFELRPRIAVNSFVLIHQLAVQAYSDFEPGVMYQ